MAKDLEDKKDDSQNTDQANENSDENNDVVTKAIQIALEKERKEQKEKSDKAIREAVAIEKKKLYDTLEKEKSEKKKIEGELNERLKVEEEQKALEEAKLQEQKEAKERLKELEARQKEFDTLTKKQQERFEKLVKSQQESFQEELVKRDLNEYRLKVIAEAKGKIIPELVSGVTKEEVDEAVVKAKERYTVIVKQTEQAATKKLIDEGKLPEPDGEDKDDKKDALLTSKNIYQMSDKEFDKYEKEFMDKFKVGVS